MTTIYEWNNSSDTGFTGTTGSAPSLETAGSYGERWKWPATTAVAYGYRAGLSLGDFGVRFVYTLASFATSSHSIFQALITGPAAYARVDLSTTGRLRIRNASNTQLAEGTVGLVVNTQYRIEIFRSGSTLTARAYNMAGTLIDSITGNVGASTIERMYFGNNAGLTGTLGIFTIDEILIKDVGSEVGAPVSLPTASAGVDQVDIHAGDTVTLDGSGSTGSAWQWTLVGYAGDNPGTVTISSDTSKVASYTAPTVTTGTVLEFEIEVDGVVTDTVYHTILGSSAGSVVWKWESSADSYTGNTGTAPSASSGGTFGSRLNWPTTTAVAYIYKSGLSLTNFGVRFVYSWHAYSSASHSVFQCLVSGPSAYGRVDISLAGKLRIRNASNTQLSEGTYTHVIDTEYRFEIYRSGSTLTVKTYNMAGTLLDTITGNIGSSTIERMYFGNNATPSGTMGTFTMDEIVVKNAGSEVGPPAIVVAASAGEDQVNVVAGSTVTLDGSASGGSTWAWSLVGYTGDNPGTITLTGGSTKTATFKAPPTMTGNVLQYRITVNGTYTDDVFITILPHREWWRNGATWEPLYINPTPPVVNPPDGSGGAPPPIPGWTTLEFADYFEGDTLDLTKWWARNNKGQSPTNQQALYLASQIEVGNHLLTINVDREDITNGGTAYKWKSGGIQSDGLMELPTDKEWYLECRLKVNMVPGKSRGFWPAYWMRNAPSVGEIDNMEAWGTPADHSGLPHTSVITLWQNTSGAGSKIGKVVNTRWDEWVTLGCHGNPLTGEYKFYQDGVLMQSKNASDASWLHGTEYSSPFYVRLEVQVSGSYWGVADDTLVNTNAHYEFLVDYVRAFSR